MNSCTFIGRLTSDAQLKQHTDPSTGTQMPYISFAIAVNRRTKQGDNVTYVSCTKHGDNANLLPYLLKGKQIAVSGRISAHAYTDRNNQMRASLDLSVTDLYLVGSASDAAAQTTQTATDDAAPYSTQTIAAAMPQPQAPTAQPQPQPIIPQQTVVRAEDLPF